MIHIPELLLVVGAVCFAYAAWKHSIRFVAAGLFCWLLATLVHGELLL